MVLIGHSLGADVLFNLTERLERETIPVRLVVPFDPTASYEVTKNVDHLLNLYQLNGFGRRVSAPKGYKGELVNMDFSQRRKLRPRLDRQVARIARARDREDQEGRARPGGEEAPGAGETKAGAGARDIKRDAERDAGNSLYRAAANNSVKKYGPSA